MAAPQQERSRETQSVNTARQLFDINGKIALVTGGSRGIGRMIAESFVAAGAKVYISSRKAEDLVLAAEEMSGTGRCVPLPADLSTEAGCRAVADEIGKREQHLNVLVNNAGAVWVAPFEKFDDRGWDRCLSLNLKAPFHLSRFLAPLLRKAAAAGDAARIINVGSADGVKVPVGSYFSYTASKAGLHHLTRHLARALAPEILVNCIAPGPFRTAMLGPVLEQRTDEFTGATLLGRTGEGHEIGGTAVFLASRASGYITGSVLAVDGGLLTK